MPQASDSLSLAESSPWLKDPDERHRRILEVVERDSVIEELPPFSEETRRRIAEELRSLSRSLQPHVSPE